MLHCLVERSANDLLDQPLAPSVRVLIGRQIQLRIQREDAVQSPAPLA